MDQLPLMIGAGALGAYLWSRGRRQSAATPIAASRPALTSLSGRWAWPVPTWQGRRPVISDGVGSPRPGGQTHRGVDIMYARASKDRFTPGTPNGSAGHVMPDGVFALAAGDGVVWSAGQTPRGYSVVIDHGPSVPVATYYTHLEKLLVTPTSRAKAGQRVRAGDPIGVISFDPLDGSRLKHLHFEIWHGGPSDAIDPAPFMRTWNVVADPRPTTKPSTRNASLVYRPVGASGEPYPSWVRDLRDRSGVYVIREVARDGSSEIVYVGQSHTGRLYETLTRHLQTWRRWKGFWKGQYAEGHDPGLTYDRDSVEVAVRVTSPSEAIDEEARLIRRLKPRDNLLGQAPEEVVPF